MASSNLGLLSLPSVPLQPVQLTAPSTVVVLQNMVSPDELKDPEEYEDIVEDVNQECSGYGTVKSVFIPRPGTDKVNAANEVGKIFVEYGTVEMAQACMAAVSGRKFAGRVIMTDFFP